MEEAGQRAAARSVDGWIRPAILILTLNHPRSRHSGIQAMDGKASVFAEARIKPQGCLVVCHPWSLDFGIHAEMTAFPAKSECWDKAGERTRLSEF